jgi:hypothetical protein
MYTHQCHLEKLNFHPFFLLVIAEVLCALA